MTERPLAVVTGAARGIGLATSRLLAERGYRVAMLGRDVERLTEAAKGLWRDGGHTLGEVLVPIGCDVALETSVAGASQAALALGAPALVVNNAGVVRRGARVHESPLEAWDEVMSINLRGAFLVTRAFLPAMLEVGRGRVVFVASISATLGSPGAASYAASKWGQLGLMKSLAEELRGTGVETMAVLPGSVDTDMLRGSGFEPKISADDVARSIVWLGLDAPGAMHGSAVEMFGA